MATALILTVSCQKNIVNEGKGEGYLSFAEFALELDETVDTKATEAAGGNYSIFILDAEGLEVVRKSYSEVKENDNKISLTAGEYTVVVRSQIEDVPVNGWENPVYGTSSTFSITPGEVTPIGTLTCTLLQCRVTVDYSDEFLAAVTGTGSTKVTVTAGYPLEYTLTNKTTYERSSGYFAVNGENTTMEVVFQGQIDGKSQKMTKVFAGIKAKQWRQIKFVQKKNEQGQATFDIVINDLIDETPLNEDASGIVEEEESLGDDPNAPKGDGGIRLLPNYTAEEIAAGKDVIEMIYKKDESGAEILDENGEKVLDYMRINITDPIYPQVPGELNPDMLIKLKAVVPGGIKKFNVDIETDSETFASAVEAADAFHLNLISPSDANMIIFDVVPFPKGQELVGQTEVPFDLSNAQCAIYNYSGNHSFMMTIRDNAGCSNTIKVVMVVAK